MTVLSKEARRKALELLAAEEGQKEWPTLEMADPVVPNDRLNRQVNDGSWTVPFQVGDMEALPNGGFKMSDAYLGKGPAMQAHLKKEKQKEQLLSFRDKFRRSEAENASNELAAEEVPGQLSSYSKSPLSVLDDVSKGAGLGTTEIPPDVADYVQKQSGSGLEEAQAARRRQAELEDVRNIGADLGDGLAQAVSGRKVQPTARRPLSHVDPVKERSEQLAEAERVMREWTAAEERKRKAAGDERQAKMDEADLLLKQAQTDKLRRPAATGTRSNPALDYRKQRDADLDATRAREKEEKKRAAMAEVEERAQNIDRTLAQLEEKVKAGGTYEMLGPHNEQLEALITSYATDMAKLRDPTSVAREGEVALEKKSMFEPGTWKVSNSVAEQLVKDARKSAADRRNEAYRVRGLEAPGAAPTPAKQPQTQTKVGADGKTYFLKPNGKWATRG